jgi:hypothetical protein
MAPETHVRLLVSLADITDHVTVVSETGTEWTQSLPVDADPSGSVNAIAGIREIIQALGGKLGGKRSTEPMERDGAPMVQMIEKTLAELADGIEGRKFVEQAWPLAEAWLRSKEQRTFRVKYGEAVLDLRTAADVESVLALMKDAVAAPRPKPAAKPKAKALPAAKAKPKPAARAKPRAKAKPAKKAAAKARPAARKASRPKKAAKKKARRR